MNINDYVGIPYQEQGRERSNCDCYGLLRILYADFFKIDLPTYENIVADRAIHNRLILAGQKNWQEVVLSKFGDVVCFRIMGLVCHVGMMLDRVNFIHAWNGSNSCIEKIDEIVWRHRIDGIFRHID